MKKNFYAIMSVATIMFIACNGNPKGVAADESPQCNDTANVVPSEMADTDTASSVQETAPMVESDVQETPVKAEEKAKEVTAQPKPVEIEKAATKEEAAKVTETANQSTSTSSSEKEEKPSLVGTWVMQTTDIYNMSDEKVESQPSEGASWEFTDRTVTVHDEEDYLDGTALPYTLNGKQLKVQDITITFTVVQLTATKLVLRSSEFNESYNIFTFKRK